MAKKQQQTQQPKPILTYAIIFLVGFICGTGFAVFKLDSGSGNPTGSQQQTTAQSNQIANAIAHLEAEVTANPDNFQAWVDLGHQYFDSNQYQKAITAYTTSLKYHSGDANLLTDLGVMYRRVGQPEKAIEWFNKAQTMDATHQPSRFNEGIVKFYDLKDVAGAVASWEELLTINPEAKGGNGQNIRDFVDGIKKEHNLK